MRENLISNFTKKSLVLIMVLAMAFTLIPMVPNSPIGDVVEKAMADEIHSANFDIGHYQFHVTGSNICATNGDVYASNGSYVKLDTSASNILATNATTYSNTYINDNEGVYLRVTNGEIEVVLNNANIQYAMGEACILNNAGMPLKIIVTSESTLSSEKGVCIDSCDLLLTVTGAKLNLYAKDFGIVSYYSLLLDNTTIFALAGCNGFVSYTGNIGIANSTVFASASNIGIRAFSSNVNFSDSIVTVTAGNYGIQGNNIVVDNNSEIHISAGAAGVVADKDIHVLSGSISAQIQSSAEVQYEKNRHNTSSDLKRYQVELGAEFASGLKSPECIFTESVTASPNVPLYYFKASGSNYSKQSAFSSGVTDIIVAANCGTIVTLSSGTAQNSEPVQSTSLYLPDPYVEAIDGTLHKSSEVNFYNEALHQKEVVQIQNDVKSWKVTVRTTLAKKGIKLYAYLNGFDTEELYSYLDKGYTVQYDWYKAAGKNKKYKYVNSSDNNYFYDKDVKIGKTYFYKCKITIYDENGKIVRTQLKDCKYGCRKFK